MVLCTPGWLQKVERVAGFEREFEDLQIAHHHAELSVVGFNQRAGGGPVGTENSLLAKGNIELHDLAYAGSYIIGGKGRVAIRLDLEPVSADRERGKDEVTLLVGSGGAHAGNVLTGDDHEGADHSVMSGVEYSALNLCAVLRLQSQRPEQDEDSESLA
jgi:hypothetical protein